MSMVSLAPALYCSDNLVCCHPAQPHDYDGPGKLLLPLHVYVMKDDTVCIKGLGHLYNSTGFAYHAMPYLCFALLLRVAWVGAGC